MAREGNRIVLTPSADAAEEKRKLLEMLDELRALPKPPYVEDFEPIEFPTWPRV